MGWIQPLPRSDDDDEVQWEMGPNLKQEFITNIVPLPDDVGLGVFFLVSQWFLHLSVYCNWRFVDLDESLQRSGRRSFEDVSHVFQCLCQHHD